MSFITSPGVIVPPLTAGGVAYGTGSQAKMNSAGTSGQFLQSAGAGVPIWAAAGGFSQAQVFTSSGTFTVPASGKFKVTIVGGGGGGSYHNSATTSGGSGGGAGTVIKWYTGATAAATATVTIGAGGAASSTSGIDGNTGGASTFVLTGFSTLTASGGGGGLSGPNGSNGGVGGTATNGDVNVKGQHGGRPVINTALSEVVNTMAGGSLLGFGGTLFQQGGAVQSGTGYGGGGTGVNSAGPPSGAGTDGICIVEF